MAVTTEIAPSVPSRSLLPRGRPTIDAIPGLCLVVYDCGLFQASTNAVAQPCGVRQTSSLKSEKNHMSDDTLFGSSHLNMYHCVSFRLAARCDR
jgi:hypothetical protein